MNVLSHFLEGGQHEIPAKMKVNPFQSESQSAKAFALAIYFNHILL